MGSPILPSRPAARNGVPCRLPVPNPTRGATCTASDFSLMWRPTMRHSLRFGFECFASTGLYAPETIFPELNRFLRIMAAMLQQQLASGGQEALIGHLQSLTTIVILVPFRILSHFFTISKHAGSEALGSEGPFRRNLSKRVHSTGCASSRGVWLWTASRQIAPKKTLRRISSV